MFFYIVLITAVITIPKKSLVSIVKTSVFPVFHLISSEAASQLSQIITAQEKCQINGKRFSAEVILLMSVERRYFTPVPGPSHQTPP